MECFRRIVKAIMPPAMLRFGRSIRDWSRPCASWEEAKQKSTGYDSPAILARARAAMRRIKEDPTLQERDTVVFPRTGPSSWPLLASLLWVASKDRGRLAVLDFGGSLGSTFFEYETAIRHVPELSWNIVEQPLFVASGIADFSTERLLFFPDITSCQTECDCNVFLMSSVLQYLEKPYDMLASALAVRPAFFILDRTAFHARNCDCVVVQRSTVARESYPCWFLNEARVRELFEESYDLVWEWPSWEDSSFAYPRFKGFVFVRRTTAGHEA